MKMTFRHFPLLLVLLGCLWQCANPIAPTGGPRDETPPRIDTLRSTPNLQTNFRPRTITLTFDEWIKLQDANQQVIISPPLQGYTTKIKGKSVIVDLGTKDTLRNNVTYVIQFGTAVKDLTESNPAEDLRFVFSTGPFIDSLELQGQVVDAYTEEPVKEALVLLYENLADSVFRTERPFYFGRTNAQGLFLISNVRAGTYKITALVDADANYRFNQVTEKIAFRAAPVVLREDSIPAISLRLFQEQLPLQLAEVDSSEWGQLKLAFNRAPGDELTLSTTETYLRAATLDTVYLWHQAPQPWTLFLASDTLFYDTLRVPAAPLAAATAALDSLRFAKTSGSPTLNYPSRPYPIRFNRPVSQLDTNRVTLRKDTFPELLPLTWTLDSTDHRLLLLNRPWTEKANYFLTIAPGGIADYWGVPNVDTLRTSWNISERKRFGNIDFQFSSTDSTASYALRLLVKGKPPVATFRLRGTTQYQAQFTGLLPGDYQLEIIEDRNDNGRWDTGSYATQRQPERVVIRILETLRANWDLDVAVDLDSLFQD